MRRLLIGFAAVTAVVILITAVVMFLPRHGYDLCHYIRKQGFRCVKVLADPNTIRPGGIVSVSGDKSDLLVDLPNSYLDNATCLIPGVTLSPWAPNDEKPFQLPSIEYGFGFLSRLGGKVPIPQTSGVAIDADAAAGRASSVTLSFGPARSSLLDENVLFNRIEGCEISPKCVARIKGSSYHIINRILQVDGLSYVFSDSRGARVPLGLLLDSGVVRLANESIDVGDRNGSSLNTKYTTVIGVNTIEPERLTAKSTCTAPILYYVNGESAVKIGGGGRPGFIEPRQPVGATFGNVATLSARGTEEEQGNFELTASHAVATASVNRVNDQMVRLTSSLDIRGGHYAHRNRLGGIESGHDTSANGESVTNGRINVLVRTPGATLDVTWSGFQPAGPRTSRRNVLELLGPSGAVIDRRENIQAAGTTAFRVDSEGYYSLRIQNTDNAEGSGWDSQSNINLDATVQVSVRSPAP